MSLVFCLAVFLVGCSGGESIKIDGFKVKIERSVSSAADPWVEIACASAVFDYEGRRLTIKGLSSFHGGDGGPFGASTKYTWITPTMSIVNNDLIVLFPDNAPFHIYIGEQYHFLPIIKKVTEKK